MQVYQSSKNVILVPDYVKDLRLQALTIRAEKKSRHVLFEIAHLRGRERGPKKSLRTQQVITEGMMSTETYLLSDQKRLLVRELFCLYLKPDINL